MKKSLVRVFAIVCTMSLILVGIVALHEVEGGSKTDPSGRYRAVVTFHGYESWLSRAPGDSSGKSGFIAIYDQRGESYGKIPVEMIAQLSDLRWTDHGARIPACCEWDFDDRTYRYWNASQTHETIKNAEL